MANDFQDPLFILIRSLTKSEKRHFRLHKNNNGNDGLKFIQLFDALDNQVIYNEEKLLQQVPSLKKVQLANLKANLYKNLLSSLRAFHAVHNLDIQLHEQLDYARVLYNKGLYKQSLKILEKAKNSARQNELSHIALSAIEFEKLIESQYITRSLQNRAEILSNESMEIALHVTKEHELSNMALLMYGLYIKVGHARNKEEHERIKTYFYSLLPQIDIEKALFFEKLYYYQAHVWYHYLVSNFKACYKYAQKWVDLFETFPDMKEKQPSLYLKGLHNLLAALFNLLYPSKFRQVLEQLEHFNQNHPRVDTNTEILFFLYTYTNKINNFFLEGKFTEGTEIVNEVMARLNLYEDRLDPHRMLVFYYKIASLYFGSGDNIKAIEYLNKIIQFKDLSLREDLQCFARILNLIAHFDAGRDEMLESQIKSVYHFLGKMNDQQQMQIAIFRFLRNLKYVKPDEIRDSFRNLKDELIQIAENPYERRPFFYLDILSWLESKIENMPVQEIIKRKMKQMK
jgi:hypothetical protein